MPDKTLPSELSQTRGRRAWLTVVRTYLQCDALLASRLAAAGVRMGEHEVLINLARTPGMTQQELAQHSFSAKSGISMLVAHMEKQGLVQRNADAQDARIKRVTLTAGGEELALVCVDIQAQLALQMTGSFSDEELDMVERLMLRAIDALGRLEH